MGEGKHPWSLSSLPHSGTEEASSTCWLPTWHKGLRGAAGEKAGETGICDSPGTQSVTEGDTV